MIVHYWKKGGDTNDKANIKRYCIGYLNPKSGKSMHIWEKLKELVELIKTKTGATWLSWSADTTNSMSGDHMGLKGIIQRYDYNVSYSAFKNFGPFTEIWSFL